VARKNSLERQEPRIKPWEEPGSEGWPFLFWLCWPLRPYGFHVFDIIPFQPLLSAVPSHQPVMCMNSTMCSLNCGPWLLGKTDNFLSHWCKHLYTGASTTNTRLSHYLAMWTWFPR
jgi:hypothetical protein